MANVVIIGAGNIGSELRTQLERKGHKIVAQARRGLVRFDKERPAVPIHNIGDVDEILNALYPVMSETDAVMLAIPNGDKGVAELRYMEAFRREHNVTCAKGAHAYHHHRVLALGKSIGRRATVGGGTDMLEILRRRQLQDENATIYAVVNGTLNYVWSTIQRGGSFAEAIADAKGLKYAEPNNNNPLDILFGELSDVCMKSTIIKNVALPCSQVFTADAFDIVPLKEDDIRRLTSRNARYRFIVTFSSVPDYDEIPKSSPGSIRAKCGRWKIVGGFHDVKAESPWFDWLRQIDGVNNGFTIHNSLGKDTGNSIGGPGAGPEVTAKAMVRDLEDLLAA